MPPAISVVLPVYNSESTLSQALDSLLHQRFESFEVIVVDDGSEDSTPTLLKTYAEKDSRIRPVFPGRKGLIDALNIGLENASAPFLARMDADDRAHPNRLLDQEAYLSSHPIISVVSCLIECFPRCNVGKGFQVYESWLNSLISPADIAREIFIESPIVHPSILARKISIEKVNGYKDFGWAEDYDLWLRLHLAGESFAKVPEVLHYWRESPGRLTRTDSRYSVENFLRAKAHYLRLGPLADDPRVIIWGSGQIGRRISKHLVREGVELIAFVDIDPKKIGNTRRGAPIIAPEDLANVWKSENSPLILASVPSRGARQLIRERLESIDLVECQDFLCVA